MNWIPFAFVSFGLVAFLNGCNGCVILTPPSFRGWYPPGSLRVFLFLMGVCIGVLFILIRRRLRIKAKVANFS